MTDEDELIKLIEVKKKVDFIKDMLEKSHSKLPNNILVKIAEVRLFLRRFKHSFHVRGQNNLKLVKCVQKHTEPLSERPSQAEYNFEDNSIILCEDTIRLSAKALGIPFQIYYSYVRYHEFVHGLIHKLTFLSLGVYVNFWFDFLSLLITSRNSFFSLLRCFRSYFIQDLKIQVFDYFLREQIIQNVKSEEPLFEPNPEDFA